ncbi:hypothetical protein [Corallococcus terminator]|uniref:hypothetical protein n=1 Tax=Corallococcus terminator TaxID=2316733 RepID=UPI0011C36E3D|nr:hypothetical protein [Corallococcus terminator]
MVEDLFEIAQRGLIIAPGVDLGARAQVELLVELRRPDGGVLRATARAQVPFGSGRGQPRHMLCFKALSKRDIPLGTEVWLLGEAGAEDAP